MKRLLVATTLLVGTASAGCESSPVAATNDGAQCDARDSGLVDLSLVSGGFSHVAPEGMLISSYCVETDLLNRGCSDTAYNLDVQPARHKLTFTHPALGYCLDEASFTYLPAEYGPTTTYEEEQPSTTTEPPDTTSPSTPDPTSPSSSVAPTTDASSATTSTSSSSTTTTTQPSSGTPTSDSPTSSSSAVSVGPPPTPPSLPSVGDSTPSAEGGPSRALPTTGSSSWAIVMLAFGLVVTGAAVRTVRR